MRLLGHLRRQKQQPPHELDRLILAQLHGRGANLALPRHVLHFLYFEDEASARRAAPAAERAGFEVTIGEPDEAVTQWSLRAEATRVVDYTNVDSYRSLFERIAADHGGEYDGWEAAAGP
jgi:Regulator of ribonuclease activity B